MKTYKLQQFSNGISPTYRVTVPSPVGRQLPAGIEFACRLVEDGILYTPIAQRDGVVERTYKLGRFKNGTSKSGNPHVAFFLTVPKSYGERLDRSQAFACEVTEEGLLYRPSAAVTDLPAWARRTLRHEIAGLGMDELTTKLYFTGHVVERHQARRGIAGYEEAVADLLRLVRHSHLATTTPAWSDAPRDDSVLLEVPDVMTLIVVRGRRPRGAWQKPYLVVTQDYCPRPACAVAA